MMDRIAVSNIAWTAEEDRAVGQLLADSGVRAIEVAPNRLFADPLSVPDDAVQAVRGFWRDFGIEIVAMQALLFGQADFAIFGPKSMQRRVSDYLKRIIDLAGRLGCGPLVFGSPKNRQRGSLPVEQAYDRAADFFRPLAAAAHDCGCTIAIEPNAVRYDCDFINRVGEAAELVRRTDSAGIGINLDAGVFELEADDPATLRGFADKVVHFHASRPFLAPLDDGSDTIGKLHRIMRASGYGGYVSIEMRRSEQGADLANVRSSLDILHRNLARDVA